MKKIISLYLALIMLILTMPSAFAQESETQPELQLAPLSEAYQKYMELDEADRVGLIPPLMFEVPFNSVSDSDFGLMGTLEPLPIKYDLRDDGFVSPIRNQGYSGSCWAFGGLSNLESYLLMHHGEQYTFSPRHLDYSQSYHFKDGVNKEAFYREVNSGGSTDYTDSYLFRGAGPVLEDDMKFSDTFVNLYLSDIDKPIADVRLNDFRYLPPLCRDYNLMNRNILINEIKKAVMENGSVGTGYNSNNIYYHPEYSSYYEPSLQFSNHEVSIIGWDDTYPSENFIVRPSIDGAWIVRNSWGEDWGDSGYFYMSYLQDTDQLSSVKGAQIGLDYDNLYYHDPLGFTRIIGYGNENYETYAANVFEKGEIDELLTEVVIASAGYTEFEIYVNSADDSLTGENVSYVQNGVINYAGYKTVKLEEPVTLTGDKFAVIVKYYTPGTGYGIPIENKGPYYFHLSADADSGQSFLSLNGQEWKEISSEEFNYANCSIKAYTKNTVEKTDVTFNKEPYYAQVTVKKDNKVIKPKQGGLYQLDVGEYTYDVTGYNCAPRENQVFEITEEDTEKTITVELVLLDTAPKIYDDDNYVYYGVRNYHTEIGYNIELGTNALAATDIEKVTDKSGNELERGIDYYLYDSILFITTDYTNSIILSEEELAADFPPFRELTVVLNDINHTSGTIVFFYLFAGPITSMSYIVSDIKSMELTNSTTAEDVAHVIKNAYINPKLKVLYEEPIKVTQATEDKAGRVTGKILLLNSTNHTYTSYLIDRVIQQYSINGISVEDGEGNAVTEIFSPQTVFINISGIANITPSDGHYLFINTYCKNDKRLLSIKRIPLTNFSDNILMQEVQAVPNSIIKAYIWSNMDTVVPMSDNIEYHIRGIK